MKIKDFKITNCKLNGITFLLFERKLLKKIIYISEKEMRLHILMINRATLDIFNPNIYPKIKHLVNAQGVMLLEDMEEFVRFPGGNLFLTAFLINMLGLMNWLFIINRGSFIDIQRKLLNKKFKDFLIFKIFQKFCTYS